MSVVPLIRDGKIAGRPESEDAASLTFERRDLVGAEFSSALVGGDWSAEAGGGVTGNSRPSGVKVAASTVWEILKEAGIGPAPQRSATTWATFQRGQAEAILACDFFETVKVRRRDRLGGILHEYEQAA